MAKELKEELTTLMHSEFTIDAETEIMHKAWTAWECIDSNIAHNRPADVDRECKYYGITIEQLNQHKESYLALKR